MTWIEIAALALALIVLDFLLVLAIAKWMKEGGAGE